MKSIASLTIRLALLVSLPPAQADSSEHHSWNGPLRASAQFLRPSRRGRPRRLVSQASARLTPIGRTWIDIWKPYQQDTRNGQDDYLPTLP